MIACSSASSTRPVLGALEASQPADDTACKHVDQKGDVDKTAPSRNVCEIRHPKLIGRIRREISAHIILGYGLARVRACRARCATAGDAAQTHISHKAFDRTASDLPLITSQLAPDLAGPVSAAVDVPGLLDSPGDLVIPLLVGRAPTGTGLFGTSRRSTSTMRSARPCRSARHRRRCGSRR